MTDTKLFTSEEQATQSLARVFGGLQDHFDGHRTSTELYFLELLRGVHPNFYVVCTTRDGEQDLHSFAAAGHAEIFRDNMEDVNETVRGYLRPSTRMDPSPGRLFNRHHFARFQYKWNNLDFLIYVVEYMDPNRRTTTRLDFILSPRYPGSSKEGENSNIDQLMWAIGIWGSQLHDEIYVFDQSRWTKDQELWKSVQGSSWKDVILEPAMKENLIKDVQAFFDNQELYKKLSVPWKRGLILHGVPGNGKTISIKALINSLAKRPDPIPSLYVKNFDSCSGEKYSINLIFQKARQMAPCLLIFEDLDSLVTDKTRSYFLNEVDGLESNDGILMIGSTNHLDNLDPAISKRPSRFDRKYNYKLPGEAERIAYCQFWREKLLGNDMVDFPEDLCPIVARLSEGFSFAYLKELFIIALLTIARGTTDDGMGADLTAADHSTVPADDGGSSDGHVVVEHGDAISETANDVASIVEESQVVDSLDKKKRVVPQVEIPDNLKNNVLLKVIVAQVSMLLDEMDNTVEGKKSSVVAQGNPSRFRIRRVQAATRVVDSD